MKLWSVSLETFWNIKMTRKIDSTLGSLQNGEGGTDPLGMWQPLAMDCELSTNSIPAGRGACSSGWLDPRPHSSRWAYCRDT